MNAGRWRCMRDLDLGILRMCVMRVVTDSCILKASHLHECFLLLLFMHEPAHSHLSFSFSFPNCLYKQTANVLSPKTSRILRPPRHQEANLYAIRQQRHRTVRRILCSSINTRRTILHLHCLDHQGWLKEWYH